MFDKTDEDKRSDYLVHHPFLNIPVKKMDAVHSLLPVHPNKQMIVYEKPKVKSDGISADYYVLPAGATQLQHIISAKNMNAQMGEIFRATMRYGEVEHSNQLRDINKILFYAQAEKERLLAMETI